MADLTSTDISILATILILLALAVAIVTDVARRKIYNTLTFPVIALGLALNSFADGPRGLLFSVTGLVLGAALFSLPVAFLGRGAGDLKLLAAVGAVGGPAFVFWCALFTGVAGGLMSVAVLLSTRRFGPVLAGMALDASEGRFPAAQSNIRLPYAIPIATGALAALAFV